MAQTTWEKVAAPAGHATQAGASSARWKYLLGGVLLLGAVVFLVISNTLSGARYFITVEDLLAEPEYVGQTVRISGAVLGESIEYDSRNLTIRFTISHIPQDLDNLALALHESVNNPLLPRVEIYIENEVKPDLLQHEAQAILTGTLGADGVFHATELLLKCPSRLEEGTVPDGFNPARDGQSS